MSNDKQDPAPLLLLVEDDPISRAFLRAALESIPARVEEADSIASALVLSQDHCLWLIDANLPDGSGSQLLSTLRARHPDTPAFAHTADHDPGLHARLLADGFDQVLVKPLSALLLQQRIRERLGVHRVAEGDIDMPPPDQCMVQLPLWDEAVAMAAINGNRGHLLALREMFLHDLASQRAGILAALADGDQALVSGELHKLRASSGFVGALRLASAAARLQQEPGDAERAREFDRIVDDTCASAVIA